jgi:potassium-transporting ATPase KdpC subunit
MKILGQAIKIFLFMTLLTGIAYPLLITGIAGLIFPHRAGGSVIEKDGRPIGSMLIGQDFADPKYFWPRPSATNYDAMPSGGSSLGPTSNTLKETISKRREALQAADGGDAEIPVDLLFASASGLDPEISPAAARYQVGRIIKARHLDEKAKTDIFTLIDKHIETPTFGLLGEPRINVLSLNLALDSMTEGRK